MDIEKLNSRNNLLPKIFNPNINQNSEILQHLLLFIVYNVNI